MTETELIEQMFEACKKDVRIEKFNPQIALIFDSITGDAAPLLIPDKVVDAIMELDAPAHIIQKIVWATWATVKEHPNIRELLSVVFFADTWFSTYKTDEYADFEAVKAARLAGKIPKPKDDPKRHEALMMIEHRKDGMKSTILVYERKNGELQFREADKDAVTQLAGGRFGVNLYPTKAG